MRSICLILLLCLKTFTNGLANVQHSTERKTNQVDLPRTTVEVLPYVLQKKKSGINTGKQYTLLTAATVTTVPNTRFQPTGFHVNINNSREKLVDKTESAEIDVVENALPKVEDWQHIPYLAHTSYDHEPLHGYKEIAHAFRHYYGSAANGHPFGLRAPFPIEPTSVLLLINLSVLFYLLLSVLGLLNRILGAGFSGVGGFPLIGHAAYNNLGHGQFVALRKVANEIQSEYKNS